MRCLDHFVIHYNNYFHCMAACFVATVHSYNILIIENFFCWLQLDTSIGYINFVKSWYNYAYELSLSKEHNNNKPL